MFRFLVFCLLVCIPPSLTQDRVEVFKAEIFLDRTELDSGLYEGKVKGRRLFGETQVPHGQGTIYYFTNDRFNRQNYTGDWKEGTRDGNGTTHFKDGAVYRGGYKDSLESGLGSIWYPNGNQLEAEFKEGRIEGHGVFRYANGDQREGFFRDNTLDGQVIFTRNDGVTVIEKWNKGTRLEEGEEEVAPISIQDGVDFSQTVREHSANGHILSGKTKKNGAEVDENGAKSEDDGAKIEEDGENHIIDLAGIAGTDLELIKKAVRAGNKVALFSAGKLKAKKAN